MNGKKNGGLLTQFNSARRALAPIVAITTPDPASTMQEIKRAYPGVPLAQWNVVDGVQSMNNLSQGPVNLMHTIEGQIMPAAAITGDPVNALRLSSLRLPASSILFFHNAHFYVEQTASDSHKSVIQAVWNQRDAWKDTGRTLVLLAPAITLPIEIRNDVALIDEPLPTDKDMATIVARGLSRAKARRATKGQMIRMVDAVSGLAAFNAEQIVAMSVDPNRRGTPKPDMEQIWVQKIKLIEQARGLRVFRHSGDFSTIGGNDNIKNLLIKIARSARCPRLVVFLDEIEKTMQAAGTDTSGTTTDQLKVLLTVMQDYDWIGIMIYGFAGTGKSELAKAFGNEAGCPTVEADLGAMKNMWVGSSEANMRSFIKTIYAMGGNKVFFIATCNSVANLRPEFKRRFRKGIFFCDLPAQRERDKIWEIYFKKWNIPAQPKPNDEGWTGAEIRLCCENAYEFGITLIEASHYMTITSQAMGDEVEKLRMAADGKYIDAQKSGIYKYIKPEPMPKKTFLEHIKGGK